MIERSRLNISSFELHIFAMLFMLCDHLWGTLFISQEWLTCIGRIAFPIFCIYDSRRIPAYKKLETICTQDIYRCVTGGNTI